MSRVIAGRYSLYGPCNAPEHLDRLGVLGGEVITALLLRWRPTVHIMARREFIGMLDTSNRHHH
jgi:hypothetical protein